MLSLDDIEEAKQAVSEIHLNDKLVEYIFAISQESRNNGFISAGISTRGAISMAAAARAAAYLDGRSYVIPEDVKLIAGPVAAHRLILLPEHQSLNKREVLLSILDNVTVPMV